ncbi:MAG: hypothetical protein ACI9R3_002940 [Verrucomicrobiales bacterium]|jgi:hypothetical protein
MIGKNECAVVGMSRSDTTLLAGRFNARLPLNINYVAERPFNGEG